MKRLFFILILSTISANIFSQFSLKTELKYIEIVNNQNDEFLTNQNLKNAEFIADSLIFYDKNDNNLSAQFLYQLAKSYFFVKKYDLAFFTLLKQRCFFPNKKVENQSKNIFNESAFSNNISDSLIKDIKKNTGIRNIKSSINEKYKTVLKYSIQFNTKRLSDYIYNIGLMYRNSENNIPVWYQHWEFLTIINLKPKHITEVMKYAKTNDKIYNQINNKKLKYKVYRKAFKHYRKQKSYGEAGKILKEYRENKLGFFLFVDAFIKNICLKIRD